jgi:UDP-N-acetylmuramoylalanine--D-glutamate ligase
MTLFGYGKTTSAIAKCFGNCKIYDDKFETKEPFLSNELCPMDDFDPNQSTIEVVSPGISPEHKIVQSAKNLISEYDLFASQMPYSIWISGTNGKTTTTAMLTHLLKDKGALSGGNIGTPLAELDQSAKMWILETSSFTLHYTKIAKPNLYILLPISEDHISWHGSYEAYQAAKLKPLGTLAEGEIAIIPESFESIASNGSKMLYSDSQSLAKQFDIEIEKIHFREPFLMDALLAMAVSKILFNELDYDLMNQFVIDPHKVEYFRDKRERTWIDDSKATNCDATINALLGLPTVPLHLILGGDDKGAELTPLFESLKNLDVRLYLIGKNYQKLAALAQAYQIEYQECGFLDVAVIKIDAQLEEKGIAILSPAAASLDQFSSYKARGIAFKSSVAALH